MPGQAQGGPAAQAIPSTTTLFPVPFPIPVSRTKGWSLLFFLKAPEQASDSLIRPRRREHSLVFVTAPGAGSPMLFPIPELLADSALRKRPEESCHGDQGKVSCSCLLPIFEFLPKKVRGSEEMAFDGAFSRSHGAGNLLNAHAVQGFELKSQSLFFGQRF